MAKFTPTPVGSGFQSTTSQNADMTEIARILEDEVLFRDNPSGANQMENTNLDLNSNDIINVDNIDAASFSVGGVQASFSNVTLDNGVKYYVNIAAAKAATDLELNDLFYVIGRPAKYKVVSLLTGTDDDGAYFNLGGIAPNLQAEAQFDGIPASPRQWGTVGDGATDDSAAVSNILNQTAVRKIVADEGDIFYVKNLVATALQKFTWDGGKFKFNRTSGVEINTYNWNGWPTPTAYSTGEEWLLRITAPVSGRSGVRFKNVDIDGNGEPFASSAGYPNQFVKMIDVVSCKDIIFDNVNIDGNNGNGLFVYNSERIHFTNGSVTNTIGLTGAITPFEQINLVASSRCNIQFNDFGGMSPNSCINTAGGYLPIADGTEVGGFVPFNTDTVYTDYTYFGLATGETDTWHVIANNVCRSDVVDAAEAGGGGVLGRMITINSGRCFVKDNVVYDTTGLSQGGIGLGHDDTPTTVNPAYGRMASRTEVSGNVVWGFSKVGQGYGILNNGSEDCDVHHNEIYNCLWAVYHTRSATTSKYTDNWIFYNDLSFAIGDFAGTANSHGITSLVQIERNNCWNNLQDIETQDNTNYADLKINDNDFVQVRSNALVQFDVFHGLLEFNDNRIVNNSSGIVGEFFTRAVGRRAECKSTSVECLQESSADLFFFDGSSGDAVGRGKLTINDLDVDCPVTTLTIEAATKANPCQLTITGHGMVTGGKVRVHTVGGMVELNDTITTITRIDDDNFTLDGIDSTAFTTFTSGGTVITGTVNRRLNIRRDNTKGLTVSNLTMNSCKLVVQSKSGEVSIKGGMIQTQGTTDECISVTLADATNPRMAHISGFLFPLCGASTPMLTTVSGASGYIVVSDCHTKENKEVTNKANGATMRNNDCWKVTSGTLTASRP